MRNFAEFMKFMAMERQDDIEEMADSLFGEELNKLKEQRWEASERIKQKTDIKDLLEYEDAMVAESNRLINTAYFMGLQDGIKLANEDIYTESKEAK